MRVVFVTVVALLGLTAAVSYEGYKVYRINPMSQAEIKILNNFRKDKNYDFWSQPSVRKPFSVMVAPKAQENFTTFLKKRRILFKIEIDDVERMVQLERERLWQKPKLEKGKIAFDDYTPFDEINAYLAQLEVDYPDLVTVETIGQSYEGRDMNLIHIGSGESDNPTIFIDAGMHAREWIAPAVALYTISQLVENPENINLTTRVNWIILPSLNPDGYQYTWDTDRFWRKTRTPGVECDGVDANRNYDFHWMEAGASDNECDSTYGGPEAWSEVENRNLRDFILSHTNIKLYLNLHSYGQQLLYPWSYTTEGPDNWQELEDLGRLVNSAIVAVRGTQYTVGTFGNALYLGSGDSIDWVLGVAGINLSYTMELVGGGTQGFDLPPEEILPVCTETWEGFKMFHDYVALL